MAKENSERSNSDKKGHPGRGDRGECGATRRRDGSGAGKGNRFTPVEKFDELSNEAKINHNFTLSILGLQSHMMKPKQIKKIKGSVEQKVLGFKDTLQLFSGNGQSE